jgi:hypothetical protein
VRLSVTFMAIEPLAVTLHKGSPVFFCGPTANRRKHVWSSFTVKLSEEQPIAVSGITCHLSADRSSLRFRARTFQQETASPRKPQYEHACHNLFHSCSPYMQAALLRRSHEI